MTGYNELRDGQEFYGNGYKKGYEEAKKEYARPKGKWIIIKDEKYGDNVKCPFCGKELAGTDLNFCCKCGADMRKAVQHEHRADT